MKFNKIVKAFLVTNSILVLGACGVPEESPNEKKLELTQAAAQNENFEQENTQKIEIIGDSQLQEIVEGTVCEMCNMEVYTKEHDMGVFAGQTINADGSVAFFEDIGCLLEENNETAEKYVRDYNSLAWVLLEQATIVKTDLVSPMNWGYIYFKEKESANQYLLQHPTAAITELALVTEEILKHREEKMKHMSESETENTGHTHTGHGH